MNADESAYPFVHPHNQEGGLTKKEAVALAALQGLLAQPMTGKSLASNIPNIGETMVDYAWAIAGLACEKWK